MPISRQTVVADALSLIRIIDCILCVQPNGVYNGVGLFKFKLMFLALIFWVIPNQNGQE